MKIRETRRHKKGCLSAFKNTPFIVTQNKIVYIWSTETKNMPLSTSILNSIQSAPITLRFRMSTYAVSLLLHLCRIFRSFLFFIPWGVRVCPSLGVEFLCSRWKIQQERKRERKKDKWPCQKSCPLFLFLRPFFCTYAGLKICTISLVHPGEMFFRDKFA